MKADLSVVICVTPGEIMRVESPYPQGRDAYGYQ